MGQVYFWGNSLAQLRTLPQEPRSAFAWAALELEKRPRAPPDSRDRDLTTEAMRGESDLYRIAVGTNRYPPGYRGIYYLRRERVYFLRFRYRDPSTYRGLRKDLGRLLSELEHSHV